MTSNVAGIHLPESLYGPCGCLRYREIPTPKSKDAAQRASCPLATAQQDVSSSTAGAQRSVAEAQEDVSSSTAGAQRAVAEAQQDVSSTAGAQRAVYVTSTRFFNDNFA
jgi:hypothetical protein